ncbi:hypothetical protein [Halomontanus rarus]|uniref:hypothetical protein n=1 Tax=Halomontanus rarus TaxID=3034020 RepID=UPI0023E89E28|nr:hypothetical protein [Halovivax sp. TS33]
MHTDRFALETGRHRRPRFEARGRRRKRTVSRIERDRASRRTPAAGRSSETDGL